MNSMPPILVSQSFSASEVPADEREKNRLIAALEWNFEFTFIYMRTDRPAVTVLYNQDDSANSPQDQFTISSSAEEGLITLTASRRENTRPMTLIEIIPADSTEIEVIAAEPDRRVIRFKHDGDLLTLNIKIPRLDVRLFRGANAGVEIEGAPPSRFVETIIPFLERKETFHFDKLTNDRELESLIAELLALFFESVENIEFGAKCSYSYSIEPSLPETTVPVLLMPPTSAADYKNIAANLAERIKEWWHDSVPVAGGTFNFEISADFLVAAERHKLFRFSRIVLPAKAISDLPTA